MARQHRFLVGAALVLGLGWGLTGCSSGTATSEVSSTAGPTAQAAPAAGSELSPKDFAAALKRSGTVLIDVRTPGEFAEGHLPGAVNIDVESAAFVQQVQALDPAGTYALYCRSGNRSGVAMANMMQLGFGQVYHLSGGIGAWQDAGGDVVSG